MASCIYHRDKVGFDRVRKDLQKAKIIPRKYGPRLAMAVCSCRKRGTSLDSHITDDITSEKLLIMEEINRPHWDLFPDTKSYIQNILNLCSLDVSQTKFVCIFHKAMKKNFEDLKEEMKNEEKKTKKKHYLNQTGIARLIARKKKACPVKGEVTLPIFGGNTKQLERTTGKGFCKTGKEFDCVVKFESDKTREYMNANKPKTVVTIWCKSHDSFRQIQHHLKALSDTIQGEETMKHEKERQRRTYMRQYRMERHYMEASNTSKDSKGLYFEKNRKEILSDDYAKKRNKDTKHKTYHCVNKEELSPLRGGHCLNCFKPFDSLKGQKNDECIYHRGYQKYNIGSNRFQWTCCGYYSDNEKATFQVHRDHGCETGRHVWRTHQKASRGDKSEKMYWQRILKRKR